MFPHSNFRYRYVKVNCEMHGSKHLPMQYNRREEKTAVIVWIVSLPDQDSWTLLSIIVQNNSIDSLSVTLIRDNGKPVIRHDPHKLLKRATDINDTQSIKCMNLRAIYIYLEKQWTMRLSFIMQCFQVISLTWHITTSLQLMSQVFLTDCTLCFTPAWSTHTSSHAPLSSSHSCISLRASVLSVCIHAFRQNGHNALYIIIMMTRPLPQAG